MPLLRRERGGGGVVVAEPILLFQACVAPGPPGAYDKPLLLDHFAVLGVSEMALLSRSRARAPRLHRTVPALDLTALYRVLGCCQTQTVPTTQQGYFPTAWRAHFAAHSKQASLTLCAAPEPTGLAMCSWHMPGDVRN